MKSRQPAWLYKKKELKRVYFSAFIPPVLSPQYPAPSTQPLVPLLREHRLYQADWLLRFYQFELDDLVTEKDGNLSLEVDPKMGAALHNPTQFPVEINKTVLESKER